MQGGAIPNLTDEQRKQLSSIRREASDKHWNLMGKVRTERLHLQDLYSAESPDPEAIGAQQKKLLALRQQMIDVSVDAQKRLDALLTKEQKEALRAWRRGWMMGRQ
jgi:Spy/CpxP family protein refolding chaperone